MPDDGREVYRKLGIDAIVLCGPSRVVHAWRNARVRAGFAPSSANAYVIDVLRRETNSARNARTTRHPTLRGPIQSGTMAGLLTEKKAQLWIELHE
jgi:hypothetical protein